MVTAKTPWYTGDTVCLFNCVIFFKRDPPEPLEEYWGADPRVTEKMAHDGPLPRRREFESEDGRLKVLVRVWKKWYNAVFVVDGLVRYHADWKRGLISRLLIRGNEHMYPVGEYRVEIVWLAYSLPNVLCNISVDRL